MPASRIRVRMPHEHRGLIILSTVVGLICGISFVLYVRFALNPFFDRLPGSGTPALDVLYIVCFILLPAIGPALCVGLYYARCCQHPGPVFLAGQLFGSSCVLMFMVTSFAVEDVVFVNVPDYFYLALAGGCVGGGTAVGIAYLGLMAFYKNFVAIVVTQDGTMCPRCAYHILHIESELCPECGHALADETPALGGRIYGLAALLGRYLRVSLSLVLGICVAAIVITVAHHLPVWRFQQRFDQVTRSPINEYQAVRTRHNIGNAGASRILVIDYYRHEWAGPHHMTITLANSSIRCELDPLQAEHVLQHGLPDDLAGRLTHEYATSLNSAIVEVSDLFPSQAR